MLPASTCRKRNKEPPNTSFLHALVRPDPKPVMKSQPHNHQHPDPHQRTINDKTSPREMCFPFALPLGGIMNAELP